MPSSPRLRILDEFYEHIRAHRNITRGVFASIC